MARFKADPYDVYSTEDDGTEVDFGDALARLEKMHYDPNGVTNRADDRWGTYNTSLYVMDNIKLGQPIVGTMFMAKREDLPLVGGASGISPPAIKPDDGMGKHVSFLWDKQAKVFWFQRDRSAFGLTAFKDYVMSKTGLNVQITPRIHEDAIGRVNKLKDIKRIEMVFSRRAHGKPSQAERGSTIRQFIEMRDRLDAATIEIVIKPGRGMYLGQGARGLIRETAKAVRDGWDELRGAKVLGVSEIDDDDEKTWHNIDLLRDKMHFDVELQQSKFRDEKALMAAIRRLWHDYRSEVKND